MEIKKKKGRRGKEEEEKRKRNKEAKFKVWKLTLSTDSNIKNGILKFCMNFHAIGWLVACP